MAAPPSPSHQNQQEPFSQIRPAHQDTAQDDEPHSETGATYTLNVPNPAVAYGGVDPEIEENYHFARGVSDEGLQRVATPWKRPKLFHHSGMSNQSPSSLIADAMSTSISDAATAQVTDRLLQLPAELIDTILSYISPLDLAAVAQVCSALNKHSNSELHWRRNVLDNLPNHAINTPYPCSSWRDLYISHEARWFLTKHKIWFCDRELTGHVLIVRYDERRGCIEGYQLIANRERDGSEPWSGDAGVHIHYFEPRVRLHLDRPIIQFDVREPPSDEIQLPRQSRSSEYPMRIFPGSDPRCSTFLRAKRIDNGIVANRAASSFPYGFVWPPPAIPADHRVIGQPAGVHRTSITPGVRSNLWQPNGRDEASDQTFRIRHWLELGPAQLGVHIGEEVTTYSTLDPYLYTPTAEKPWRGIWVGDYSGHGSEFLLINQPDKDEEGPEEPLVREADESEEMFQERFLQKRVYQGRLEGIKLTGDPNVPRGEYTFVADDLGDAGFVGDATEPPFQGARMVRSKGHIAQTGFHDHKYISSQLILLSHNRLAQYWVDFGHISYFERVNIDKFLVP